MHCRKKRMLIGPEQREIKVGVCSENLKKEKRTKRSQTLFGCFLLMPGEECIRKLEMSGLFKAILSFFNVVEMSFLVPLLYGPEHT